MATSEQYAAWIVKNKDLKGTPEFETVAKAYELSRQSAKPAEMPNPEGERLANLPPVNKFLMGAGNAVINPALGLGQLTGLVPDQYIQERQKRFEPLEKESTAYGAGKLGGEVALGSMIPGANTLLGGAAIGGAIGLGQRVPSGGDRWSNIEQGALVGAAAPVVARTIPAAYNAFVSPFFEKGREKIAGNVLRNAAGQNVGDLISKFSNPEQYIAGSLPSAAEIALTPEFSTLQKAVRNLPEAKAPIVEQEIAANQARREAIRDIAKTPADIEAAKLARKQAANVSFGAIAPTRINVSEGLAGLFQQPEISSAARASNISQETLNPFLMTKSSGKQVPLTNLATGKPLENTVSVGSLHKIKMALDDALSVTPTTSLEKTSQRNVGVIKDSLLKEIDKVAPEYSAALREFAQNSKPIDQMEILQALQNKLIPALTDKGLATGERAAMFANAVREQAQLIKNKTGMRNLTLEDVLTPEQSAVVKGIQSDLTRKANARELAATAGSDTASNLIANNMLENLIGPIGMPKSWASQAIGNSLLNALPRRAVEAVVPSVEKRVQGLLGEALANPKIAAELMRKSGKKNLADLLAYPSAPLGAYGVFGAQQ